MASEVGNPVLSDQTPFADLPAVLVEEVLEQTVGVAEHLLASFTSIRENREVLRRQLVDARMVLDDSSLGFPPMPTTCGVDGSYAIERLLTTDLAASAAVAVEGLTPPSEKRHWEQPRHKTFIAAEPHLEDTATILRAVMLGEELRLACMAPHDLVVLDGTLTLPIIYFNQALTRAPFIRQLQCSQVFLSNSFSYLEAYATILRARRSDKHYVGLPKYSTRREIGAILGWPEGHDDRGMLTLLLGAGELTCPRGLGKPTQSWHLSTANLDSAIREQANELAAEIVALLERVSVLYYKPHLWLPALRIEVAESVATNTHRLATVVQGIKHQCATPSILEPYPNFLADRIVKALARAIPAFRQVTTQQISEQYDGDVGEVFFAMHSYRSEAGR